MNSFLNRRSLRGSALSDKAGCAALPGNIFPAAGAEMDAIGGRS